MARDLQTVFAELGISQYLSTFVDQGFDTWDTILDITESDLDTLGVKLGHRRKLQRRIANTRGHGPEVSLAASRPISGDSKGDGRKVETATRPDGKEVTVVTKRKYRRHPKPDENAPERPPSAYVLFSNKMREDLKGRNLTFTEIAKLVGENWQSLSASEKEPYESQALSAKERYNQQLAEYKKTPEYKKYCQYLHDFKQKQASQNQDATKRLKLEAGSKVQRTGSSTSGTRASRSGTGSGSESFGGSEESLARNQRMPSTTSSLPDAPYGSNGTSYQQQQGDEPVHSPTSTHFGGDNDRSPVMATTNSPRSRGRRPTWSESQMNPEGNSQKPLPSLSDVFSDSRMSGVTRSSVDSTGPYSGYSIPGQQPLPHGPPSLIHEPSPAGSMGSSSSGFSHPRTPSDASLPIHALLSNKSAPLPQGYEPQPSPFYPQQMAVDQKLPYPPGARGLNGHGSPPALMKYSSTSSSNGASTDDSTRSASVPSSRTSLSVHENAANSMGPSKADPTLDGMDALLRAGEIVGRRE